MEKLVSQLDRVFQNAFEGGGYDRRHGAVSVSNRPDLCQFQCNGALPAAKQLGQPPRNIAEHIVTLLGDFSQYGIQSLSVEGPGFINIILQDKTLADYLNQMSDDHRLGVPVPTLPQTIVVDYGGANVAKPLHVGHLRAAIIGESIKRIARFCGHRVVGDVHLGDWGLQIGMIISELERRNPDLPYFIAEYDGEYPKEPPFTIDALEEIYPAASKLAKSDEVAMEAARSATAALQNGNKGYLALWQHIITVSIADLKRNYDQLNVEFDLWNGESSCQKSIPALLQLIEETGLAYQSQGALVMDVLEPGDTRPLPPIMLLKSDGATLYSTTDLATILERVQENDPDEIIYVVDKRQGLHFDQVFRCSQKIGLTKPSTKLSFIGFGTMNGKDGKPFKTRDGGVMRLQDLIETIKGHVRTRLKENAEMDDAELEDIANKVGISALKYGDLSNQATKDYVFDLDRFASFDGNTGPYILYTIVRIKSILRKAQESNLKPSKILPTENNLERALMLTLVRFNETVEFCFVQQAPHKLCDYVYEVSNLFNKFYHDNHILTEQNVEKRSSWLGLLKLTMDVLLCSMDLLGIETPERM